MLFDKIIDLEKVRTDNLKISSLNYGWLVSNTIDDCFPRQIAKKTIKLKIEAFPVKACHCMACKHCRTGSGTGGQPPGGHAVFELLDGPLVLATDLAANFGCN